MGSPGDPQAPNQATEEPSSSTAAHDEAAVDRLWELRAVRRLLWVLVILAVLTALHAASVVFVPLAAALLLSFLFKPMVRRLEEWRVPPPASALLIVGGLLLALLLGGSVLGNSLAQWVETAPQSLAQLEQKVRSIRLPMQRVSEATSQLERMTEADEAEVREPVEVKVRESALPATMLSLTTNVMVGLVITTVLVFFLLASGDLLLRQLVQAIPRLTDKKQAVEAIYDLESHVSMYLLTVASINAGLAVVVGTVLWLLGVPHAMWWGMTAGAMNFIPYAGPLVTAIMVFAASLLAFDTLGQALLPPMVFVAITSLEGYVVTPLILGRRLSLNPLVVFLWLVFWGWIWGVPGALLAVPLLVCLKIVSDHVERLETLSNVLSGYVRRPGETAEGGDRTESQSPADSRSASAPAAPVAATPRG